MTKTFTLTDWRGSITLFKTFNGTRPFKEVTNASWEDITKEIKPDSPNVLEDKTKALCFLPCELKEAPLTGTSFTLAQEEGEPTVGKMRSKQHVTPANLLVIDIDGMPKASFDSALDKMNNDGISYVAYTTFSHGLKPDMRVRLVAPLDREVSAEEYPAAWHGLDELYFDGQIGELDPSGAKLCQHQATWSSHLDRVNLAEWWEHKAEVVSVDSLVTHAIEKIEFVKKVFTKERTNYPTSDANMVADACKQIGHFRDTRGADQPEPYWFDSLGIVGHCEDGERISHEWSSGHDDYNHFQTEKKLAHRLAMPPTTCDQFKRSNPQGCEGCNQACHSPITLGYKLDNEALINALASLNVIDYEQVRKEKAKELGVKVTTLDAVVKAAQKNSSESSKCAIEEVEPYPEAVNVKELLDEILGIVLRHVVIDVEYATALSLWVAFTYFTGVVETAPLLVVNAPDSSCGKSVVTAILRYVVARPLSVANSSMAFVYRAIELWGPTLIFDEIDTFMKANNEVIGVINAGYTRENAFVGRTVGENFEPKMFNAWSAKVLSGITADKYLSKATMSRAIEIKLRRKLRHEMIVDFRYEDKSQFKVVQAKLARMAIDHSAHVRSVNLSLLPDGLSDREQDNWIYLLMIAQLGGDEWLDKAKQTALAMHANVEPSVSTGVELLSDIREIFALEGEHKISTADLIEKLTDDAESAWSVWNRGKPISPRQLAKLLDPYGIKSKNLKFNGSTLKGFEGAQFEDAFERYLEPEILPQPRNDTSEPLIYKASGVADDTQHKSAVAQRYDDLLEDIF